jgi:hypothetical protein
MTGRSAIIQLVRIEWVTLKDAGFSVKGTGFSPYVNCSKTKPGL